MSLTCPMVQPAEPMAGRTGTLNSLYLMKEWMFTAPEAIAWVRYAIITISHLVDEVYTNYLKLRVC